MYVCVDITPVNNITGICIDDNGTTGIVGSVNVNPVSFSTDDWSTITAALKLGSHPYRVGDTKTVDMGSLGTHKIRLSNLTPCDGSLSSQTACGVVLEFSDVVSRYNMNPAGEYKGVSYSAGYNVDGWPASAMRTYVNNKIYAALPAELKSAIINTNVVSGHGSDDKKNFVTTDKLYLLSTKEIWGEGTSSTTGYDSAKDSTRQLDYYKNNGVTVTNYSLALKKYNTSESFWWLRAPTSNYNQYFYGAHVEGKPGYVGAYFARGVSPAFRIA